MTTRITHNSTPKNLNISFKIALLFVLSILFINSNIDACHKTWTGQAGTDWADSNNWSPAGMPDSTMDVIIPSVNSGNYPVISNGTFTVKNLKVNTGANLIINGDMLTVVNLFKIKNGAAVTQNNGFVNVKHLLIQKNGTYTINNGVLDIIDKLTNKGSLNELGGFIYLQGEPMPVELTSFSARIDGTMVSLNWETATEVNNYGFDIEKSSDMGKTWNKIGFVNGYGNSNSPKYYSFSDNISSNGTFYYRLLQIDNDGQSEYSDYIEVVGTAIAEEFELAQNYPNPFNPTTKISYSLPSASEVSVKVYDMLGNEVRTLVNEMKDAGSHAVQFDASNLSSGIYIYAIQAGEFTKTMKMTLVK
jgi:hypothetical protein